MCGIVGYFNNCNQDYSVDKITFNRIIDSLGHRGPDGRGCYQQYGIGLGHRRLAILDPSERSAQPMSVSDGNIWITFNGEIYNFPELRRQLIKTGHEFNTTGDTEVILHAYMEWGCELVNYLNGIFAFAIWDKNKERLILARDHLGVKPLFYSIVKDIIYFASEIHTMLKFPAITNKPNPHGIDAFFTYSYVPAPLTAYKDIYQLKPGELLIAENRNVNVRKYWDLDLNAEKINYDEDCLVDLFKSKLQQAVNRQMISDVPIGVFLSGGIDSYAIANMIKNNNTDFTAYSIGFSDREYDELDNAALSAKSLGIKLTSKRIEFDFDKIIEKILPYTQDPFADSSSIPTFSLCKLASNDVKVVLGGDGADEMLAGYQVYSANKYAAYYRKLPTVIKNIFHYLVPYLPDWGNRYTLREKAGRFIYGSNLGMWNDHASWRALFTNQMKEKLYSNDFKNELDGFNPLSLYTEHMQHAYENGCSVLDCCLYADLKFYLPNDMLVKIDRMSMAHGLEVRVPFLDIDLVDFCWRLPESMKKKNGTYKRILRMAMRGEYPEELEKLPKSGFNMQPLKNSGSININNTYINNKKIDKKFLFGKYHYMMIYYMISVFNNINSNRM